MEEVLEYKDKEVRVRQWEEDLYRAEYKDLGITFHEKGFSIGDIKNDNWIMLGEEKLMKDHEVTLEGLDETLKHIGAYYWLKSEGVLEEARKELIDKREYAELTKVEYLNKLGKEARRRILEENKEVEETLYFIADVLLKFAREEYNIIAKEKIFEVTGEPYRIAKRLKRLCVMLVAIEEGKEYSNLDYSLEGSLKTNCLNAVLEGIMDNLDKDRRSLDNLFVEYKGLDK